MEGGVGFFEGTGGMAKGFCHGTQTRSGWSGKVNIFALERGGENGRGTGGPAGPRGGGGEKPQTVEGNSTAPTRPVFQFCLVRPFQPRGWGIVRGAIFVRQAGPGDNPIQIGSRPAARRLHLL